jgi:hypothetical protein
VSGKRVESKLQVSSSFSFLGDCKCSARPEWPGRAVVSRRRIQSGAQSSNKVWHHLRKALIAESLIPVAENRAALINVV